MFRKLIDANILYDAFTNNANSKLAINVLNEPVCIFEGVLYELSNLLKNTINSKFAVATVQNILQNPQMFQVLGCTSQDTLDALAIMLQYQTQKPKKDFSLCDSIQLILAQKHGLILFTTDQRMTFFDQNRVVVKQPYSV